MMTKERLIAISAALTRACLISAVFFVPIYFAWLQENFTVFDLNKSVALHVLMGIALIAWLLEAALKGMFVLHGSKTLNILWAGLAVIFLISTIFSLHPQISLWGSYERQQGLYNLWHYLIFFFLAINTLTERRSQEIVLRAFLGATLLICIYGLAQAFGLDPLNWGDSSQRIFSSFGQPNFLGHFLVVVMPLTIYAAVWLSPRLWQRISYSILIGLELICLVLTYSRGAWLALAISILVTGLYLLFRSGKKTLSVALIGLIGVISVTLILSPLRKGILAHTSGFSSFAISRLTTIIDFENGSNRIRLFYWNAALTDLREAPLGRLLIGYGPDTQASIFVKNYQPEWAYYEKMNSFPDRAHNFIFDVILQFGLIGFLLLGTFIFLILRRLLLYLNGAEPKHYWYAISVAAGLLAYGINNLFSFSLTALSLTMYVLLAMAWLAVDGDERREYKLSFFQPLSRLVLVAMITIFLFTLLFSYNLKPLVADYYYFEVKKAEARGNCKTVMADMEKVLSWYPLSHYYARAYLHHGANCFSAATTAAAKKQLAENLLEQAQSLPPQEQQYYTVIDLAHLYSLLGYFIDQKYYPEAERLYKQQIAVSPAITISYQDYGRLKMWQKKYDEAIGLYRQGLAVTPTLDKAPAGEHGDSIAFQRSYFHELIGTVYEEKKMSAEAEKEYLQASRDNPRQISVLKKLADLAYARHELDKTIAYTKQAYSLEPNNSGWPASLALLYKEKKDWKTALSYARQALELNPKNEAIIKLIKELEKK